MGKMSVSLDGEGSSKESCRFSTSKSTFLYALNDLKVYNKSAEGIAKKFFKIPDIEAYYKANDTKPLIFSHFAGGLGDKIYNEIETFDGLQKILEEALAEYNETNAVMDLVLFGPRSRTLMAATFSSRIAILSSRVSSGVSFFAFIWIS